jgi:hypothetical protein
MLRRWIVLMEATAGSSGSVDPDDVRQLLAVMDHSDDGSGGALQSSDRYAVQVTTTAPGPAEALAFVVSRWTAALRELGLPVWPLVRTEVLTPEELERDRRNDLREDGCIADSSTERGERGQHCRRGPTSRPGRA